MEKKFNIGDPKTAFLSELKELLGKYDASLSFGLCTTKKTIGTVIQVGNERMFYPFKVEEIQEEQPGEFVPYRLPKSNYPLQAGNIMNYEKG